MSTVTSFQFESTRGGLLDAKKWIPDGEIRGIVQMVHGMAEHIDRYAGVAEALNASGYLVTGHNHAGHGTGAGIKGYFGEKDGWQRLIDDVHCLREQTAAEYPGVPYFILGHSMGSFVVRCYLTQYASGLAGAVISGTGYYGKGLVLAGLALANMECALGKTKKESPLINNIAFSGNNKPFEPGRTGFEWLTRDEEHVDRYVADPLCGFLFTAGGYRDMFRGLNRLTKTEDLKQIPSDLPILFISGQNDPVGSMGAGVTKVSETFRQAGMKDVTVKLYSEARHELFNELNRAEVYADLAAWLESRCTAAAD